MVKRSLLVVVWVLLSAIVAVQVTAQDTNPPEGHFIEGGTLTFVFDPALYRIEKIETIGVIGIFNDFNADATGWQLTDEDEDGVWTLEVPLGDRIKAGSTFRFLIN